MNSSKCLTPLLCTLKASSSPADWQTNTGGKQFAFDCFAAGPIVVEEYDNYIIDSLQCALQSSNGYFSDESSSTAFRRIICATLEGWEVIKSSLEIVPAVSSARLLLDEVMTVLHVASVDLVDLIADALQSDQNATQLDLFVVAQLMNEVAASQDLRALVCALRRVRNINRRLAKQTAKRGGQHLPLSHVVNGVLKVAVAAANFEVTSGAM